ncbi:sugar transferase (plasmid) [Salipiger sp. H15]|uniref:Sugar transferase n=1 Tax=Alloyangia sp. H15 TaxID=3029062 RepID=A0AAU8APJ8_9RHOB
MPKAPYDQNPGDAPSMLSPAIGQSVTYRDAVKRGLDVVLSLLMLPMLAPVILCLYVAARMDGGPGFFGHARVGRNGELFKCWKIRTMVPDAKERLEELLATDPEARAEWERDQKLRCDPRVTPMGDFLRRSSLDELPQIWNVLRGEMSLIGPRPITEPELERYRSRKWVYLALRPGVTGLWQVSGRNEVSYDERVDLDSEYFHTLSLRSDLSILSRTVGAVLFRSGY